MHEDLRVYECVHRARQCLVGVAFVLCACVAPANAVAQAVLWQRSPSALPGAAGLGLAFPAPGAVATVGNTPIVTWVAGFSTAGAPIGEPGPDLAAKDGVIAWSQSHGTALAPGFGGAIVLGWLRTCTSYLPPILPPSCSPEAPWIHAHSAAGTVRWTANAAGYAAVAVDDAGAYVVGGSEARVQKFDAAGTLRWDLRLLAGGSGLFLDVAAFPGGGAVAGGWSTAGPLLQRVAPEGAAAWADTVVTSLGAATRFEKVAVDATGNVYAAGTRIVASGARDVVLVKFRADGTLLWTRARTGVVPSRSPATDAVNGLALDGGGNVIVAATASTPIDMVAWTAKFDPAGEALWTDAYATGPDARMAATSIGADAHGQIYVGGTASGNAVSGSEAYVRKIGPWGTALWTARWPGRLADVVVGTGDEVMVLADLPESVALMRLDPGPGEGAVPPALLLTLPPGPFVAGVPITLAATIRGAVAPTGVVTFRVNGMEACTHVPLAPSTVLVSTAQCALALGLPVGMTLVEVLYGGDAHNGVASASVRIVVGAPAPTEVPALTPSGLLALGVLVAFGAWERLRRAGQEYPTAR